MGAENSILEGCEWGDPLDSSLPWAVIPVIKSDGATATVFQAKRGEKKDADLLKKNTSVLRGIRHPNIVRFLGGGETQGDVWLATECVTPLLTSMLDLTSDEICAGLHDLLQAVDFLHSMLGVCHNNLCVSSLFLGHDATWKLGELQHACKFSDATQAFLDQCRAFRKEDCLAPEEKAGLVKVNATVGHARDMFAFGVVVETLLDGLKQKDNRIKELEHHAAACLSADPTLRPSALSLLKLPFLESDLLEIINFLKNVTMKSELAKKDFFRNLVARLEKLPELVIARRLVIPLLARFVLLDEWAVAHLIPHLLVPRNESNPDGLLSEQVFQLYVIPQLYNIFHVHDCHIRLILLQHFRQYVHLFSSQQLEDDIFLQILLGVRDSDDRIVAASLRALADLVPIMGGDVVVGAARKPFFFHGLPKQVTAEDVKKMSASQNVTAILSSHKPLLKDLAGASGLKKDKSAEERDRKAKEREQRKEEARLKREERRKRMKEKQTDKEVEISSKDGKQKSSSLTIEEVAVMDAENTKQFSSSDNVEDGFDAKLKSSFTDMDSNHNSSNRNGLVDVEEGDEDVAEKDAPDWTDWGDTDQQIEEEIEEELRHMSDESAPYDGKVQTSPSPYRREASPPSPSNTSVTWDYDVPEAERDFGRLAFISEVAEHGSGIATDDVDTSRSSSTSASKGLKLSSLNSSSSSSASTKGDASSETSSSANRKANAKGRSTSSSRPPKVAGDLGAGLDIKSVEIKVKTEPELDFFADMTPSIQLATSSSKPSEPAEAKPQDDNTKPSVNGKLFAVDLAVEEDGQQAASGWGDEDALDWDAEGF